MLGAAIRAILNGSPQIYPLVSSQGKTFPVCTYQVLTDVPSHDMNGSAGVHEAKMQLNIASLTYDEAESIAASLYSKLDSKSGTYASVIISQIRVTDSGDLFSEDAEVYGKFIELSIWYKQ